MRYMGFEEALNQRKGRNLNMTSDCVLDLYNWLKQNGITVWIDGGWGVDAPLAPSPLRMNRIQRR